jgi:hypothetical protein
MVRRVLAAGLLLAGLTVGMPAGSVLPAAAQAAPPVFISGNFVGDARDEVFAYRSGLQWDDFLIDFNYVDPQPTSRQLDWDVHPFTVTGNSYVPVAGDFDGDGYDEIFWHGPGSIPDSMWHFQSPTSVVSVPFTVGGSYQPLVGDYTGDGADDIHWYAPGPAGDPLWEFNAGATFTSSAQNVGGTYRPVVASIGLDDTDDTFWYGPGTADTLWDWTETTSNVPTHTTRSMPVGGTSYLPFRYDYFGVSSSGFDDIYWYTPGAAADPVWDFAFGQRRTDSVLDDLASPLDDQGDIAVAGDYFADAHTDILFMTPNTDFPNLTLYDSAPNVIFQIDWICDATPETVSCAGRADP